MNNDTVIKKIPLSQLMDVLIDLYNRGVDYIDLIGEKGEDQDKMHIVFTSDYMSEESAEKLTEEIPNYIEIQTKLTDEDLNQLL
jgi:hypothetical protein